MRFLKSKKSIYYEEHHDDAEDDVYSIQKIATCVVPDETIEKEFDGCDILNDIWSTTFDTNQFTQFTPDINPIDGKTIIIIEETSSIDEEQDLLVRMRGSSASRNGLRTNCCPRPSIKNRIQGSLRTFRQNVRNRINQCTSNTASIIHNTTNLERKDSFHVVEFMSQNSFDNDKYDDKIYSVSNDDSKLHNNKKTRRRYLPRKLHIPVPHRIRNQRSNNIDIGYSCSDSINQCQSNNRFNNKKCVRKRSVTIIEDDCSSIEMDDSVAQFSIPDKLLWS